MKNSKIIFFAASLNYGGAERQLATLARGLHKAGREVTVLLYYRGGPIEEVLRTAGVQIDYLDKGGRWDNIFFIWKLISYFRKNSPAIVHSYLVAPNILSFVTKLFVPEIKIVWGVRASDMDFSVYDTVSRFAFWLTCRLSSLPDLIIVNSDAGKRFHQEHGYPSGKMQVIHNGIDFNKYYIDGQAGIIRRSLLGYTDEDIIIGIVGRIDPMKDYETFISAAGRMRKKDNRIKFLCVGDGPDESKSSLLVLAEKNDLNGSALKWIGNQSDMRDIYNTLNILTSASAFGEGFSNVTGEAMACGVPCVVTNVGDSALIVGDTGEVVEVKSPDDLVAGWTRMILRLEKGRDSLAEDARERIVQNFSIEILVNRTIEVLEKEL